MQVSTLIYAMGPEAEDILASFGQSDDESKDYEDFMNKFDGYFIQLKNHIFRTSEVQPESSSGNRNGRSVRNSFLRSCRALSIPGTEGADDW